MGTAEAVAWWEAVPAVVAGGPGWSVGRRASGRRRRGSGGGRDGGPGTLLA